MEVSRKGKGCRFYTVIALFGITQLGTGSLIRNLFVIKVLCNYFLVAIFILRNNTL